nr:hypothetical protein [Tanacetum cinerariifolium]
VRYAGCGGGVAADSSVSNGSVYSADGPGTNSDRGGARSGSSGLGM